MSAVTIFKNFSEPVDDESLITLMNWIKEGKFKEQIIPLRKLLEEGKKEEYDKKKRLLQGFTPSGQFKNRRKKDNLDRYSKYIILDIDDITTEKVKELREKAAESPYTFAVFASPSNRGLKIIVQVESERELHKLAYKQVKEHYENMLEVTIDDSGDDVSRLCFFSYDPDLYKNFRNKKFPIKKEAETPQPAKSQEKDKKQSFDKVYEQTKEFTEEKEQFYEGNRNNFVHQLACNCNRSGIPHNIALEHILRDYNYDQREVQNTVRSAYQNNTSDYGKYKEQALEKAENNLIISAKDLMEMDATADRFLLEPILPRKGTAALVGKPDSGKSQLARQLALTIAVESEEFFDFPLAVKHQKALFVSTEDDDLNTKYLLEKQVEGLECTANESLSFIFADTLTLEELLDELNQELNKNPVDLVVIDCYGDVHKGSNTNNNAQMRKTVRKFDRIAKTHKCLILFVHHINKSAYNLAPDQKHIQGGAGFAQKIRSALYLAEGEDNEKHLAITKGNYCPREYKEQAFKLEFDEQSFTFTNTGKRVPLEELDTSDKKKEEEKTQTLINIAEIIFEDVGELRYTDIYKAIEKQTGKGIATAKRYIRHMTNLGIIEKNKETGKYYLKQED